MPDILDGYKDLIESRLDRVLSELRCDGTLKDAMAYAVAGGKRLRGAILVSTCEALGGSSDKALDFAASIEMIHAYSLVHDDLPCMDNDDFRRGKPSCHKAFGYATALLAGDALLTHAFSVAAAPGPAHPERVLRGIDALSKAAGPSGMVGGQVMDLAMEGKSAGAEMVREMYSKKTGAMFEASARLGAILAGAPRDVEDAYARWGALFGYAFQLLDDLDDLKQKGKEQEKDTLAIETSVDAVRREARASLEEGLSALRSSGSTNALALELTARYIAKAGQSFEG